VDVHPYWSGLSDVCSYAAPVVSIAAVAVWTVIIILYLEGPNGPGGGGGGGGGGGTKVLEHVHVPAEDLF
jgi:hypothetical protein